ncbi:MAG: T9SS type A sorting domain-containing protein, partial [Candidatus Marinimicrobia bacterium]|nr:T9SS type A sorting domain-containing protein [Candidatus Neomarinimicrobiota bacterium]
DLTDFSPHVGGLFELRVVDLADGSEVGRARVESVPQADFSVSLPGLAIGGDYNVDFYADLNGNGLYDSPGTDHAWRIGLTDVMGDTTLTFAHSVTNFVDIMWDYLTLNLTGMTPHLNQLFELRVVDLSDSSEVGRVRVDSAVVDFSVSVPGLMIGGSYNVDFYADFNGNGQYDTPSTDHAWRIMYDYTGGYAVLDFAHNTNFTDIGWPGTVGIVSATDRLPKVFALQQNYPNPFNPSTQIRYDLPRAVPVTLTVYNILGRQVVTLVDELQAAGSYAVRWNGRDQQGKLVGTGVYVYRIQAGPQGALRKMVFLK